MNISADFIRNNYIYSFSFKSFSSKNNSLRKPKPLSLYLASGGRNHDISIRSSIKHEFKLPESQKTNVSSLSIIPSRKDDEFGRPYFKPIVFKYNFYWKNYARRNIFFMRNFSSNFFCDSTLIFSTDASSGVSSIFNFNFFLKKNFFKKRFKFFRFKKKRKFKAFIHFPYFNFRSSGLFFSYLPISMRFCNKKILFNYKIYMKFFKFTFFKKFSKINYGSNFNVPFEKLYVFKNNVLSKFFLTNKYFKVSYKKRYFELCNSISSTFFSGKLFKRFFKNKFSRFYKSHFKVKRYLFKRKSTFKAFFKYISNISTFQKKIKIFNSKLSYFVDQNHKFKFDALDHTFNLNNFSKKVYEIFFFFKLFKISAFMKNTKNFYFTSIFSKIFKTFFKFTKFKKLKHFFNYFKFYIKVFKTRPIKISKFFLSSFFFQFFSKFYSRRYNNFSILNIFRVFFSNLLTFNNFFYVNKFNSSHKSTFLFSYFYFLFFRGRFFPNKNFLCFSTKFFSNNSIYKNYKFFNFSDFYNSLYSDYNIFSFSRYNDISVFYKSIFNSNFYSYRVSSPRKSGKRHFISTRKVDSTTFFNI